MNKKIIACLAAFMLSVSIIMGVLVLQSIAPVKAGGGAHFPE